MTESEGQGRVELDPVYASPYANALSPTDLLHDEVRQRRETGFDVDDLVIEANRTDPADRTAVLSLVDRMAFAPRRPHWAYVEPDELDLIEAALPSLPEPRTVSSRDLQDKISAAWLGRIAGCNLGKPVEWGPQWSSERIRDYLTLAQAYPLTDYIPALDPMPEGFELTACWPETTRGNVDGSARDDDIDYSILALHLLERHGGGLTTADVGSAWLGLFPIDRVYTAERAAYANLVAGCSGPDVARRRNPYREWIGAQIRGDVFGYVHAGNPWAAARLAFVDAALSHVGNGIYGEMWAAALVAAAFVASSPQEAVAVSMEVVPPQSRLAEALHSVFDMWVSGASWEHALHAIQARFGHYSWVHTVNNAALVAMALLWSGGDFTTAVGRVVMSGWDTDSNGATVGSVMGVLGGSGSLPENFVAPLKDRTRSALFGFDNAFISDLAERTVRLASAGLG